MPPRSQCTFGGGKAYQKKRKSGLRPKTKCLKASKKKRDRRSQREKQKNDTLSFLTRPGNLIPAILTGLVLVLEEKASFQTKLSSIQALHAQ